MTAASSTAAASPGCTVGCDCDRYVEVWNIVFSQFNNDGAAITPNSSRRTSTPAWASNTLPACVKSPSRLFDVDTVMVSRIKSPRSPAHTQERSPTRLTCPCASSPIYPFVDLRSLRRHSPPQRGPGLRPAPPAAPRCTRRPKLLGVNEPFLYQVVDTVVHENSASIPNCAKSSPISPASSAPRKKSFAKTIDGGMKIFSEMPGSKDKR